MTSTLKLPTDFFTSDLGIKIRAIGPEAIVAACYLAANQNANAFGLYRTSPALVSTETGLSFCSVHESFERLTGAGFLVFDDVYNLVWVREMAAWNLGTFTNERDNRVKGMRNHFAAIPSGCKLRAAFAKRYGKQLMLEDDAPFGQPLAQAAQTQDSSQRPVSEFSDDPLPDELDTSGLDFNSTLRALIDLRGMLRESYPKTGDELVQARAARLRDECGARRAEECLTLALRMNDLDLETAIGLVFPAERTAELAASYDDI